MIFSVKKKGFLGSLGPSGNHASRWIRSLWLKGLLQKNLRFSVLHDFFCLKKNWGFVVLVRLSASVERCFVSCMRDFFLLLPLNKGLISNRGDCRTAPATPGLVNRFFLYIQESIGHPYGLCTNSF